jgi:adenine-specific DNA-methyltransferase
LKVLHGDAIQVLKEMEENSIDTVYTAPSPFQYYYLPDTDIDERIGGEKSLKDYIFNLVNLCNECSRVLKPTGNLFIQIPDQFSQFGTLLGVPTLFEAQMKGEGFMLNDRLIWYRTETGPRKYKDKGFLKNYEFIFHFVHKDFYFNTNSKYIKSSVLSYPIEDSYYTNEFDSGLPSKLSEIIIDTTVPPNGVILDPLCGSAKVGVVAKRMNRYFIGIDINLETVEAARIRLGL